MKIKLAILEWDESYLERIISVFSTKYADKFEIYSFTEQKAAMVMLDSVKIDVLLVSDAFEIAPSAIPERCGFAYFVDSADVDRLHEQKAICKFQKTELIYKQILSIYSEKAGSLFGLRLEDGGTAQVILFDSVSGGAGASSMAAACALHFASRQKRVLYLNLEKFGSSDVFFAAEGQFDISDVIYALKSRKANLSLKLESCVKRDPRGVFFYSQSKLALDMLELKPEEMIRLILEVENSGAYDYVIVDAGFGMDKDFLPVYRQVPAIIWVGDGSAPSNTKIIRAYTALLTLERNADMPLFNRIALVYNKFSNKTGKVLDEIGLKNIGGAPRYEHASASQVITQLSMMDLFDKID